MRSKPFEQMNKYNWFGQSTVLTDQILFCWFLHRLISIFIAAETVFVQQRYKFNHFATVFIFFFSHFIHKIVCVFLKAITCNKPSITALLFFSFHILSSLFSILHSILSSVERMNGKNNDSIDGCDRIIMFHSMRQHKIRVRMNTRTNKNKHSSAVLLATNGRHECCVWTMDVVRVCEWKISFFDCFMQERRTQLTFFLLIKSFLCTSIKPLVFAPNFFYLRGISIEFVYG